MEPGFYLLQNLNAVTITSQVFSQRLRTFAPIATAHFFAHVTHTSCIADHEGKHDAKGANIFFAKNGT